MKTILSLLTAITLCTSPWASADEPAIQSKDAYKYVGQTVVVSGTVVEVGVFPSGSAVLNFGAKYPRQIFVIYIPQELGKTMGDLHKYGGKVLTVEGMVELYKGKPEIKLEDAGQLRR